MKKLSRILFVVVLAATLIATLSLMGCKTEAVETTAAATTAAATTAAAETTAAATTVAEDMTVPDPWIQEKRDIEKPYITGEVKFTGAEGEIPVYDDGLILTKEEVAKIQAMGLKAAYVDNNTAGEYSLAIIGGSRDTLKYLGIEMIAETSADFDATKQKTDVETVMASNPDIVIGYAVDPTTGTEVFKPVVDAKKVLVLVSNRPKGYTPGKEYVGISTNNPYDNAYQVAVAMVKDLGPTATIGIVTYKDEYFVLNVMDDAFKQAIKDLAPGYTVYEEPFIDAQGLVDIAPAMVQKHPDIQAMYTTWFDPAMAAVEGLKAIDRKDVKMYTFGMNTPALLDLLNPDGMVKALTTDFTWNVGMNSAIMAAYGILGKKSPELVVVPTAIVTSDNLRELWDMAYRGVPLTKEVDDALKALGK